MSSGSRNVKQIFLEAVERFSPDQWPAYLDQACGGDRELRQEVEILLEAHAGEGSLLDSPAIVPATPIDQPISEEPGCQIGSYKLLEKIGEGGFGAVYMADQAEPIKRRVALKIIKPGMDTGQVIARFEAERQALAIMDHPNIVTVPDAGTTNSGRPYFAMELVRGVTISEYCDQRHLTLRERLELFVLICEAVQHAHQKGIIHRDLKPSNILVALYDDRPVPKIIDFGIAKAINVRLTEKTLFTQYSQIVGTIEYMSPEQAQLNQLDVDTHSDVYALGVILYELLTGETRFDKQRLHAAAFDEILRIIRDEEFLRPSVRLSGSKLLASIAANRKTEPRRLSPLLAGELDWIVMKALEKDRWRRFETAGKLSEDVRAYLRSDAVTACPPSVVYRLRKMAVRYRVAVAVAAVVLVSLLLGLLGTSLGMRAAISARTEAAAARRGAEDKAFPLPPRCEEALATMANRTRESARTTCIGSAPRWRFGLVFGVAFPENTRGHNMKTQQRRIRWGAKRPAAPYANTGNWRCHCSPQTTHLSHLGLNAEPVIASKPCDLNHLKNFPLFLSPAGFFCSASHLVEGERFFTPAAQRRHPEQERRHFRGGVNVAGEPIGTCQKGARQ